MLAELEEKILERFDKKGIDIKGKIGKHKNGVSLLPSAYVAVEEGTFERETKRAFKQTVNVYVTIVFKNLKGEEDRRKGVYPILSGIIGILTLQTLGLDIDPIVPVRFANVTDLVENKNGVAVFQVIFRTGFDIVKLDDEASTDLLTVGFQYFADGDTERETPDASDIVSIQQ